MKSFQLRPEPSHIGRSQLSNAKFYPDADFKADSDFKPDVDLKSDADSHPSRSILTLRTDSTSAISSMYTIKKIFKKYYELTSYFLVAKHNNDLLMKNHEAHSTVATIVVMKKVSGILFSQEVEK
ncbi:hypothetical protein CR513_22648, partial [Mucuna pruriens]